MWEWEGGLDLILEHPDPQEAPYKILNPKLALPLQPFSSTCYPYDFVLLHVYILYMAHGT